MGRVIPKTLVLRSRGQLEALVSPLRVAIVEHLSASGPAPIAGLARGLGRTPHSLYYHVRLLVSAGVLTEARGREAVYGLAAERIGMASRPRSPATTRAVTRSASAVLRRAERVFHRAIREGRVTNLGREGDAFVLGREAWLTKSGVERLRRLIDQITTLLKEQSRLRRGRAYLMTALLAPIGRPAPKPKPKPGKGR